MLMEEYVFFIFVKNGQILIEHRLATSDEGEILFLPCGGIQEQDRSGKDEYRITAMKREIAEELGGGIDITDFSFLTTVEKAETMALYHSYLITGWAGELPEYGLEEGEKNARLLWKPIDEAFLILNSDVARMTVGKAIAVLREAELSNSYATLGKS
jgi:hypothetical protein